MIRITCGKPRIAVVSPWPPQISGIAGYAAALIRELSEFYSIDAFHDPGITPNLGVNDSGVTCIPAPLLPRLIGLRGYRGILYQMGNSRFHGFLYPLLLAHPGIVTLHDLRLTNFHEQYGLRPEVERGYLSGELAHDRPNEAKSLQRAFEAMRQERGGIPVALSTRGVDLNRRVFERSKRVLLHSRWSATRASRMFPQHADKIEQIPMGTMPEFVSHDQKVSARSRLGLPSDAIVLASLGILGWGKMNEEAIRAFSEVAPDAARAIFVFAGQDLDAGHAHRVASELGLHGRVMFFDRPTDEELSDLAKAADIGVNLRREPTSGETSATLFTFLGMGIPTIVTDVDSFQDEPESVVYRIRWNESGLSGLVRAMRELVADRQLRERIGFAALQHVQANHSWPTVTARYVRAIEATWAASQAKSRGQKGACDEETHQMAS